jgi:dienelactone hydrolase
MKNDPTRHVASQDEQPAPQILSHDRGGLATAAAADAWQRTLKFFHERLDKK